MNIKTLKIFNRKNTSETDSLNKPNKKSNFKNFLSQLSAGFMLPISILAFAGIFLGLGATIMSQTNAGDSINGISASGAHVFGVFIQAIGNTIFGILPLLFAISMALAFSGQSGIAGFSAVILWFGMNTLTSVFLVEHYVPAAQWRAGEARGIDHYSILGLGSLWGAIDPNLISSNAGISSFSTSVFGAIIAGGFAAFAWNRFHTIELPSFIGFFSGARFIPIMSLILVIPISLALIFVWPVFGAGLSIFGKSLSSLKFGTNALIFGFVERALVPFGLHHVFYAPLWWTSAGGQLDTHSLANSIWLAAGSPNGAHSSLDDIINNPQIFGDEYVQLASKFRNALNSSNINPAGNVVIWTWLQKLGLQSLPFGSNGVVQGHMPLFDWITKYDPNLVSVGAFDQGKFPFMIFGLPAAGAAMIMTAPKENRKFASAIIISAAATAFLTGITEPIEFTFLFLAPWLFWGIHAPLCGISFWLMTLFGAHVGMSFSGGFFDLIIYGMIPVAMGTHFWLVFAIGPVYSVIYFLLFYFLIKKFDIKTPGRGTTQLFTRADWNVHGKKKTGNFMREATIIAGFGGYENITQFSNCATRLRYDVLDSNLVNIEMIKSAGISGVMKVGKNHFQAIIGGKASVVNEKIVSCREEIEEEMKQNNIAPTAKPKIKKSKLFSNKNKRNKNE